MGNSWINSKELDISITYNINLPENVDSFRKLKYSHDLCENEETAELYKESAEINFTPLKIFLPKL